MNVREVIGFVAAGLVLGAASAVEARCHDAPWGWGAPNMVVNSVRLDTIWFVARALEVDRVRFDRGTIPPSRRGELVSIRLEFDVLASWGERLPRRLELNVSPVAVSTLDGCSPPFRHTESYDPAGIQPFGTWLLAVIRDEGPGYGYRLADWHQYRPWTKALALRYALGAPDHSHAIIDPPPSLDELARALNHDEQVRRDDALWFWLASRCGRDYLRWRLDELALPEDERALLRRMTGHFSSHPADRSGDVTFPPYPPFPRTWPRKCSDAEADWVAEQISEFKAALP